MWDKVDGVVAYSFTDCTDFIDACQSALDKDASSNSGSFGNTRTISTSIISDMITTTSSLTPAPSTTPAPDLTSSVQCTDGLDGLFPLAGICMDPLGHYVKLADDLPQVLQGKGDCNDFTKSCSSACTNTTTPGSPTFLCVHPPTTSGKLGGNIETLVVCLCNDVPIINLNGYVNATASTLAGIVSSKSAMRSSTGTTSRTSGGGGGVGVEGVVVGGGWIMLNVVYLVVSFWMVPVFVL
ncbi:hypothetical protein HDU76_007362 [Blyttiomyces sp. JEL0837]|nr:hypothetical protein HDU76_007362 [Blyttiomyces sp. JEL0837]